MPPSCSQRMPPGGQQLPLQLAIPGAGPGRANHLCYPDGSEYQGDLVNNQRHGRGHLVTTAGFTYEGGFRNNVAEGFGEATYPNGSVYVGEWSAGQRCGYGEFSTTEGDAYVGEWLADQLHGHGRWTFPDGSYFEGRYEGGGRVQGTLTSADGREVYQGEFKESLRHGEGHQVMEGLWQYKGEWERDVRHGQGECRYATSKEVGVDAGGCYRGAWQDDARCGWGAMRWPSGERYEGAWQDDTRHGKGTCTTAQGDVYEGDWVAGLRQGHGRCTFANGDKYEGEWAAGLPHGQGAMVYADGDRYSGSWVRGKRHGQGSAVFSDGTKFRGAWEEDCWVQSSAHGRLSRVSGPGISRAVAGQTAKLRIEARDDKGNRRLNGGDAFRVAIRSLPLPLLAFAVPLLAPERGGTHGRAGKDGSGGVLEAGVGGRGAYTPTVAAGAAVKGSAQAPGTTTGPSEHGAGCALDGNAGGKSGGYCLAALDPALAQGLGAACDTCVSSSAPPAPLGGALAVMPPTPQREEPSAHKFQVEAAVTDLGDGAYDVQYCIERSGLYELKVELPGADGELIPVAESPYQLRVLAGDPCLKQTRVLGPTAPLRAECGGEVQVRVQLRDGLGNPCSGAKALQLLPVQARLVGGSGGQQLAVVAVQGVASQGTYLCRCTAPSMPGYYRLELLVTDLAPGLPVVPVAPAAAAHTGHAESAAMASAAPPSGSSGNSSGSGGGSSGGGVGSDTLGGSISGGSWACALPTKAERHLPGSPLAVLVLAPAVQGGTAPAVQAPTGLDMAPAEPALLKTTVAPVPQALAVPLPASAESVRAKDKAAPLTPALAVRHPASAESVRASIQAAPVTPVPSGPDAASSDSLGSKAKAAPAKSGRARFVTTRPAVAECICAHSSAHSPSHSSGLSSAYSSSLSSVSDAAHAGAAHAQREAIRLADGSPPTLGLQAIPGPHLPSPGQQAAVHLPAVQQLEPTVQSPAVQQPVVQLDATQQPVVDEYRLWEQRARAMYAADGDDAGWDSGDDGGERGGQDTPRLPNGGAGGAFGRNGDGGATGTSGRGGEGRGELAAGERAFMAAHPDVPVVQRLEDLWKLGRLQAIQRTK